MEPAVLVRGIWGRSVGSCSATSLTANRSRISCGLFMLLLHEPNASNHSAAESAFIIDDFKSQHIANTPKLGEAGAATFVHNPRKSRCRMVALFQPRHFAACAAGVTQKADAILHRNGRQVRAKRRHRAFLPRLPCGQLAMSVHSV